MSTPTETRKARERREREEQILVAGRRLLLERGYLGLTMDRVAEAVEYSKGTVYQHFSCKESLLAALAMGTMEERARMFERASTFSGSPRERMSAIGIAEELFVQLKPEHFRACQIIEAESFQEKMSRPSVEAVHAREFRCKQIVDGIARDGVAQGDLDLPQGTSVAELTMGLYSLYTGFFSLYLGGTPFAEMGIEHPIQMLRTNAHRLLDAWGWQPLSTDWDYAATHQRILDEVFSDEARRLGA